MIYSILNSRMWASFTVLQRSSGQTKKEMEDAGQDESFERFLKWAENLGISDCTTNLSLHPQSPTSCLGHSLTVSHFPDAGG